ncbi:MAG: T9SS type A sorting domain-containing protein [Chitinophagales bacterium]|nr:T9SS type A sorting domain-containing protein [Erysipelotrichaceae bacterium]
MRLRVLKYSIFLMLVAMPTSTFLFAQDLLHNTGITIFINQGTSIFVDGNTHLLADSILKNNGEFISTGNISSNGFKALSGNGKTRFVGKNNQIISGDSLLHFDYLEVDKDSGVIYLSTDIRVKNEIILNGGNIDIGNSNIFLDSLAYITNEDEEHYITGGDGAIIIKARLNSPNNKNPGNVGVEFSTSDNLGLTTIIRRHVPQLIGGNPGIKRIYELSSENNLLNSIDLDFRYIDNSVELNYVSEMEINAYNWDSNSWHFVSSNIDTNMNWISVPGLKALGTFSFGAGSLLPVSFLGFDVQLINNRIAELKWETATEINNDYFTVQRSSDGLIFEDLGIIQGAGNSTSIIKYEYLDAEPLVGLSYYRIKQTDFDGQYDFSPIRSIIRSPENELSIFPNPLKGDQLSFSGVSDLCNFQLFDLSGKLIYESELAPNSNNSTINIYIDNLVAGFYRYRISNSLVNIHNGNLIKL